MTRVAIGAPERFPTMPSSVIRAFSYDSAEHRLDVLFVNGRCYSYYDVPSQVAGAMRRAASKGSYFNRRIRARYPFSRMASHPDEGSQPPPPSS